MPGKVVRTTRLFKNTEFHTKDLDFIYLLVMKNKKKLKVLNRMMWSGIALGWSVESGMGFRFEAGWLISTYYLPFFGEIFLQ